MTSATSREQLERSWRERNAAYKKRWTPRISTAPLAPSKQGNTVTLGLADSECARLKPTMQYGDS